MTDKAERGKPRLHTTISKEKEDILNKYVNLIDTYGNEIYGNKSRVIEKALELLYNYHNPEIEDCQTIWNRTRNELGMVLLGKTTFLALLSGDYKQAFKENNVLELIEWYNEKLIDDISLEELLEAIKDLWVVLNFFNKIRLHKGSKGNYIMSFHHDFQSKEYGKFWGGFFNIFLLFQKDCNVEYFIRDSFVRLVINPPEADSKRRTAKYNIKRTFEKTHNVDKMD
ncbi:MAG: hypothetical protein JW891_10105 [Candidatus Lokiarchaeota archaeon]|nr:hypothetical protein [Candidatus Lokiarchaeota archaeon]